MATDFRGLGRVRRLWYNLNQAQLDARRRMWQRRHNPSGHSTPGFLVGCGRSGTTMLVRHLARSWEVEAYNENDAVAFERWRLRDLPTIETIVAASHARVVLFKPILNTSQTNDFLTFFPEARVAFVCRHYDDVINSSMKKFGEDNRLSHVQRWIDDDFAEFHFAPPPEASKQIVRDLWRPGLSLASGAALYWLYYNRLYFDMGLDANERVRLVQYEALVRQPEVEIADVCRHLGLRYEARLSDGIFDTSVRRDPAPDLAPDIRDACEAAWQELTASRKPVDSLGGEPA